MSEFFVISKIMRTFATQKGVYASTGIMARETAAGPTLSWAQEEVGAARGKGNFPAALTLARHLNYLSKRDGLKPLTKNATNTTKLKVNYLVSSML